MADSHTSPRPKEAEKFAFIPALLDDYGLTPPEFRIFCRISRRGVCDESVPNMARGCRMNPDTAWKAIKFLCAVGMVKRTPRHGETTVFEITPMSRWAKPPINRDAPDPATRPLVSGATHRKVMGGHPPETEGHKGTPPEGTPFKESKRASPRSGGMRFDLAGLVGQVVNKASVTLASAPTVEQVSEEMEKQFKGASRYAPSFHTNMTTRLWRDQAGDPIVNWKPFCRKWASGCERNRRGVKKVSRNLLINPLKQGRDTIPDEVHAGQNQ